MQESELLKKTKELLRSRPVYMSLAMIAKETGLGESWLASLSSGRASDNPGVRQVETLYTYLSGKNLEL